MAFGRFAAAVNAVIYWAANPIWLGGSLTITAVSVFGEFFTPLGGVGKWLFAIVFIWIGVFSAILSLDKGKWLPTVGAFVRIVLLSVFVVTVIVYAFEHGVHGFGVGSFSPTYGVFIAAVPVLFFNYVGFELPSAAGEELKNPQRDVPFTVVRSALVAVFLYGGPVLAILLVLPISQVTNLGGFIDAIKTVFTVYGGHVAHDGTATLSGFGKVLGDVAALGFIIALLTSGITWIMGSDRAQAVACMTAAARGGWA
jgi:amino acid transporter